QVGLCRDVRVDGVGMQRAKDGHTAQREEQQDRHNHRRGDLMPSGGGEEQVDTLDRLANRPLDRFPEARLWLRRRWGVEVGYGRGRWLGDRNSLRSIGNRWRRLRTLRRIGLRIRLRVVVLWRGGWSGQTLLSRRRWRGGKDGHAYRLWISRLGWPRWLW